MRISELQALLAEAQREHGDLDVDVETHWNGAPLRQVYVDTMTDGALVVVVSTVEP